jgi:hypothetical protein
MRAGEGGQGDDLLAAVCRVPALGGDRGQRAQAREEHLRVAAGRDRIYLCMGLLAGCLDCLSDDSGWSERFFASHCGDL